ncbi:bifunctional (p)ppGpp synthetase/guanosine-3',5'-bis(diphosphate) 3'-pyrophosphohydrolase [Clostridium botulinum]|uniref:GTP diphosphokinase n=1 Tax=Clostridium botulinum D str. 1873 TaxID=592027 RepID=A0A9P2G7A7_CLOBO|nr:MULTISPECIES: bifunctional (p)ppGpp synthetase/guanosine-3',5'-bis(diphosphate) 3'-pyrophosphohydrolase [Clostridium]EES91367.1 GTP pyrophosphokinase [Clostridium botulinum D str. 1873]MBO3442026.1 bifunctional (p)ppGpp synthetase/guanosine-3',5'-bis(diphosphate) 3'-pyrophosphohydrolase [Clostridium haemolyticum]NFV47364.1 bifunctional (p)ppGpp synthetase/guanosine-3',5'-bis(diphosphate) 3'-pyrophosphohydrolase [Clostridium botulinum]
MLEDLLQKIYENCNNINKDIIIKAYNYAENAHKEQKRISGEPYIIHPVEVACILAEMGLDENTIAASLLHDVIEDTDYTYEDVEKDFNIEVANLVEGVTKLGKIKFKTKEEQQSENVRKMLLAMTKDIRVILIKLADRLHNMRTLKYMSVEKQKEKAKETLDIYAPLAHRLGISKIKWELEDLSLRYLNPNEYYDLVRKVAEKRKEREEYIERIIHELSEKLEEAGIKSEIEGRPKHFYSIYRKMVIKNKTIDQIFDLTAIRILVEDVKDCYAVLGMVHTMYKPIPGRFKDYIAMPKPNMYQSLHSTVIGPQGKPFEIQIRTYEMHNTSEYGIAAHWKYKEGNLKNSDKDFEAKLAWLREVLEWQRETSNPEEFMEDFKIDMFSDEVFVFTPKGDVINLPSDSTPIDFAYRIHTDIGHRCIGGKVNGKIVPLDYHLKTGEIVEVLTSQSPKGPSISWINMTKSNQAKSKIKSWFKKEKRHDNIEKGKELVEKEAKRQGINFGKVAKGDNLDKLFKKYHFHSIDDLYVAVSIGGITSSAIINKLVGYLKNQEKNEQTENETLEDIREQLKTSQVIKKKSKSPGIKVKDIDNVMVRFAKCCNPVPGDPIVGYITKGRGVSVHRQDCKNVKTLIINEVNRIVDVCWENENYRKNEYITEIEVKAEDRTGLLAELMEAIIQTKIDLYAINAQPAKADMVIITIKFRVSDVNKLKEVMRKMRKLRGIIAVYRTKN